MLLLYSSIDWTSVELLALGFEWRPLWKKSFWSQNNKTREIYSHILVQSLTFNPYGGGGRQTLNKAVMEDASQQNARALHGFINQILEGLRSSGMSDDWYWFCEGALRTGRMFYEELERAAQVSVFTAGLAWAGMLRHQKTPWVIFASL